MAEQAFLTEQQAGDAINTMFEEPERREVKFTAKVKAKKPKPKSDVVAMEPADGSPDPDRELPDEANPYPDAKAGGKHAKADEQDGGGEEGQEPADEPMDEDSDEEQPTPRTLKVKVDGIEQELPEDEVVKGYSRHADYTRKTQQLAEERKRFESEVVTPLRAERQEYLAALDALASFLPVQGREPDWDRLAAELPAEEFKQQFAEYKTGQARLQKLADQRERVVQRAIEDEQRTLKVRIADEFEKLKGAIPEFADGVKAKEKQADLVAYGKSLGFTDDDLSTVTDHRLIVLLEHSRLWSEQQKRRQKTEDKIDRALDAIKPSATKSKPKAAEAEQLYGNLQKSGSVDDAAALITKMGLT